MTSATGGANAQGGTTTAAGAINGTGGNALGGGGLGGSASAGGATSRGGATQTGGATTSGGASASGGASSGGKATTGGASTTGGTASAGSTGCGVPTSFKWSSSDALILPKSDSTHALASIKDPTVVYYNGRWHIYATVFNTTNGLYNMVYLNFTDWAQAGSASQYYMDQTTGFKYYHCAPQLFYFSPQNLWYLVYQSQPPSYSTSSDPSNPASWTSPKYFIATEPAIVTQNKGSGTWIDFWVICDDTNCHLFFSDDNGHLYRSRTTKASFPSGFGDPVIVMTDTLPNLFEASNVYKIKGTNKYLLLVEAIAQGRYFRSWTADSLDGTWTPLAATYANPFAGLNNVTFTGTKWANGISHGELVRDGYDETLTIDTCNMQFLYQGMAADASTYNLNPYRLGLLTKTN
ncbi:MAG: non-reducing end alpha-L-arabinofuranosidase family hydrolase [Polyangiaceae bacterium]